MSQVCNRCYKIVPRACQNDTETYDCPNLERQPTIRQRLMRELAARGLIGVYRPAEDEAVDAAIEIEGGYEFQLLAFSEGRCCLNRYEGEGASFRMTDLGTFDNARVAVGRLIRHKETGK